MCGKIKLLAITYCWLRVFDSIGHPVGWLVGLSVYPSIGRSMLILKSEVDLDYCPHPRERNICCWLGRLVGQLVGRLVGQSVGQLVCRSVGRLVGWLVGWLVSQSVSRLVGWLVGRLVIGDYRARGWAFTYRIRMYGGLGGLMGAPGVPDG